MEIRFLGTGAAQGVPPTFARNTFLNNIRQKQSREIRSKASLRVGKYTQIDFGTDTNWQNIRYGLDMYEVKDLFITHSHNDHFSSFELFDVYKMSYEVPEDCPKHPLNLYMSIPGIEWLKDKVISAYNLKLPEDKIKIKPLEYYKNYSSENFTFDTVKGRHDGYGKNESSINYLFEYDSGDSLFYALDTGYYEDETIEYLKDKKTDVMITECTFGDNYERGVIGDGHLNLKTLNMQIERLCDIGFIKDNTPVYITHISSIVKHSYEEFQTILNQYDFNYILSYDGLKFKLGNEEK